ncbi:outer membrane protein assembly factor BamE domain-containing protein [Variovorax terrae]|uniref:Outer membrane protein assembly factor BamE n=1 Tax=Variovorax terrae TaxID=2923278 RepID=A0A9X2AR18_9BURK|nr:outer membrane protein assembly factor BamE [Variovorax terrae]MCJ0765157.1 outer membrane protein assembly factor BamE [Variovorax terrae]
MGLISALLGLVGCDPQRISELEEGVSTEADVRARFGEPEKVWDEPGGARTFEYNRQPAGHKNYMITIGADGRMSALRQVLTPENFARVQPGMTLDEVRRSLGKPMKVTPFLLKNETHCDWRYADGPNQADAKIFTAVFNAELRVVSTQSVLDTTPGQGNSGP